MILTCAQQDVLDFIRVFQRTRRISPTIQEITSYFGYRSRNSVMKHLRELEHKGAIERDRGRILFPREPW